MFEVLIEMSHPALVDMTGRKIGKLTVIARYIDENSKTGSARWLCKCSCGNEVVIRGSQLRTAEKHHREPCCAECRTERERTPRVYKAKKRRSSKVCALCGNMNFRVEGTRCRRCGLVYIPEHIPRAHELKLSRN